MRTLSLAFASLSLVALPQLAGANSCPINVPLAETADVPLGCPVIVHFRAEHAAGYIPSLIAMRNATQVDITGAFQQRAETLPVDFLEYDEDCTESIVRRDTPFIRYEVQMASAQVGDIIHSLDVAVIAAGPCPVPVAVTYGCSDNGGCWLPDENGNGIPDRDENDRGCSASGGGSIGLSFALLALLARRRRS